MHNQPLVTYAIPSYNHESYISTTIRSIQNQTYKNIEIIICDDGSSDNTSKTVKELLDSDSRIQFYSFNNEGIAANRNRALNIAKGEYIAFIDSDDYISEKHCSTLLRKFLDDERIVLTFANCDIVDDCMRVLGDFFSFYPPIENNNITEALFFNYCFIPSCSTMIKRKNLLDSGGFWGPDAHCDYLKWIEISTTGKFHKTDERLASWRQHKRNTSHEMSKASFYDCQASGLYELFNKCDALRKHIGSTKLKKRLAKSHLRGCYFCLLHADFKSAQAQLKRAGEFNNGLLQLIFELLFKLKLFMPLHLVARLFYKIYFKKLADFQNQA